MNPVAPEIMVEGRTLKGAMTEVSRAEQWWSPSQ